MMIGNIVEFIEKIIFYSGHLLLKPRVMFNYIKIMKNEKKEFEELKLVQNKKLINHLFNVFKQAEFYKKLIKTDSNKTEDFQSFIWQKLPIVTKNIIKENEGNFFNNNLNKIFWKNGQTGGSTGTPLKYRLSKKSVDMALAILYRGWGRGGYRLGDRMAILAGGSLVQKKKTIKTKLIERIMNWRKYSSYGVSDNDMLIYYFEIKKRNTKFLRGYVSAIYEFASFVKKNNLAIKFDAVFTTAEMLGKSERNFIENVFSCKVFNNYGLNDGGVSAYECVNGNMHIDMERGYLEIVDENDELIYDENQGKIIATDFLNDASYFLRYDTGDLGCISKYKCSCGSPYPILLNIAGRQTDALRINGKLVGSPVLTVLMSNIPVIRYQFIQKNRSLFLVMETDIEYFRAEHQDFIAKSLYSQLGDFELNFVYDSNKFIQTSGGKHKMVVNMDK